MEERLQKILARVGIGSRRKCEQYIIRGQVRVNGKVAKIGMKANAEIDNIEFNGKPLPRVEEKKYIILYKPRGVISATNSPDKRRTVIDLVNPKERLYPVGRLDFDSEGLILLTNDGELSNILTHPKYGHEKEYKVLVAKRPDARQLESWRNGVVLEDGYRTSKAFVRFTSNFGKGAWLKVILNEGRKRQIRQMGYLTGLPVVRIIRVRIGSILLGNLRPGQHRNLSANEILSLKRGETKRKPTH